MFSLENILVTRSVQSVHFSYSVVSNSLQPHGFQHASLPYPSPISRVCSNSCPSSRWCHPTISSSHRQTRELLITCVIGHANTHCIFESLQLAGFLLVTYCIVEQYVSISWRPFLVPAFRPCGCSLLPQAFQWLLSNLFLLGCLPRPTTSSLNIYGTSYGPVTHSRPKMWKV